MKKVNNPASRAKTYVQDMSLIRSVLKERIKDPYEAPPVQTALCCIRLFKPEWYDQPPVFRIISCAADQDPFA